MTTVIGLAVLIGAWQAILGLRSYKYLIALIVIGLAAIAFLMIPRKFNFFLYAIGFTLPFFVMVILLDRDKTILALTGTTLMMVGTAVVGFTTGVMGKPKIILEPRITFPMLFFIGTCLLTLAVTTDKTLTVICAIQEMEMLFFFLVLVNAITDEGRLVIFLKGLFLSLVIECGIYYMQNALGFSFDILGNMKSGGTTDLESGRLGSQRGTWANAPATAALYFSLMTLLLTGLYLSKKKLPVRLHPLVGMMLSLSCLVLSTKRAAMSGFSIGLVVMICMLPRFAPGALRKLAIVLGSLAIPFIVCLPVFILRAEANHESAYEERANLTKVAWNMYHAHPVLGIGFGTYDSVKREYLPPGWTGWLYKVHTRYLLILSETGTVGFAALIFLYLSILRTAYRGITRVASAYQPLQIALMCGVVALLYEQVWDIFDSRQQGYLFWLITSLAVILPRVFPAEAPTRVSEAA
jgi:putative inorganic carbon (HCO3(-)) transporter